MVGLRVPLGRPGQGLFGFRWLRWSVAETISEPHTSWTMSEAIIHRHSRCATPTRHTCTALPDLDRKVDNKTVTRTLDRQQAEQLRPLLDNARRRITAALH